MKYLTKAETLVYLKKKNQFKNLIPFFIYFTKKKYLSNKPFYIKKIISIFKKNKIIVRSSALDEDGSKLSKAGKYDSVVLKDISFSKLEIALDKVIKKFNNDDDQVIIQNLIYRPDISGVIFTKDKNTNSNYYEISYDYSKKTDLITSGSFNSSLKKLVINKSSKKIPIRFIKLIKYVKIIEKNLSNERLDLEFCIKKKSIYIFQCRPLSGPKKKVNNAYLDDVVVNLKKKYLKLQQRIPYINGHTTYLSNMSDWNPAEIIGSKPTKMSISLYSLLVTNDIWAEQRANYGYKDVRPNRLMMDMSGIPYIDLRIDLNSFLPADLDNKISEKIITNCLNIIKKKPALHDKIEFQLIETCFSFDFDNKAFKFLNKKEKKIYNEKLKNLTNNILISKNYLDPDIKKLEVLQKKIEEIKKTKLSYIQKIFYLLNYCKKLGTLPFAGIARCAFVSTKILNSLEGSGYLNSHDIKNFFLSINTVTKLINNAYYYSLKNKNINNFIKQYGHLRPSLYSISKQNYKDGLNVYFPKNISDINLKKNISFKIDKAKINKIDKLFKKNKLPIKFLEFLRFSKKSIEQRELSKLIFSKAINEIFENLKKLSKEIKIDHNEFEHININTIINSINELDQDKLKQILIREIKENKKKYYFTKNLKLPELIRSSNDFDFFNEINVNENYITNKSIVSEIINFEKVKNFKLIRNKTILIENADPGYDFLFSHGIKGLITKFGGSNSHMAIRCLELEIPAIIGMGEKKFNDLNDSKKIFIDCKNSNYKVLL